MGCRAKILDLVADGREAWQVLHNPFPGIPWGNPGQYFVPHSLQRGGGRRDLALGDGGGANRDGSGGTWRENPGVASIFYADDRLVALPRMERLQREFKVITDLFDQVGLYTNVQKIVRMTCRNFFIPGGLLE